MADRVTVIGNIGQAPRRKTTSRGDVVEFTLAHGQRVQAADGAWQDGETLWYRVAVWDRLADSAEGALLRGQRVIVQGSLSERRWTGDDGVERMSRDLRANAIGRDISQRASGAARAGAQASQAQAPESRTQTQTPEEAPTVDPATTTGSTGDESASAAVVREPLPPAPAGWSTADESEEETPF